jgi:phosphomevalonate kinase
LGVRWDREIPEGFRFVARAVDEVVRAHGRTTLGFTLAMAPTPVRPDGAKLGMGSSARAALLAAEATRYVLEERLDPLKVALVAHAQTQGMRGSGGDVAAAYAGGVVRYHRFPVEAVLSADRPRGAAYREAPPADLVRLNVARWSAIYVHTGKSASTPALISAAEQRLGEDARRDFVAQSDALGNEWEEAVTSGDFPALAEATEGLRHLLAKLGTVETEEAKRVLALAGAHGCAGKTSGAGGGDGCIVFCPDSQRAAELLDVYASREIHAFAIPLEPGLRGESEGDARLRSWADTDSSDARL